MATQTIPLPGSVRQDKRVPDQVHRRALARQPHKIRLCRDNRAYALVPFTIPGVVTATDYGPEWRADRDYWIAKIVAEVGRHNTATHPSDGTPAGQAIRANMRRVKSDLSTDVPILGSDSRLRIDVNHHQDAINNGEDGAFEESDFNITRLAEGDRMYVRVLQVGTTRPGTGLVVTAVLVPIP
jgi:hypothetical protein